MRDVMPEEGFEGSLADLFELEPSGKRRFSVSAEQVLDPPKLSVSLFHVHHSLRSQFFGPFNRCLLR
jgi:hypothetical protein